jgi:hypothetical protein
MSDDITEAAIAKLERSIEDYEQKIRALRTAINTMCEDVGQPPRYGDATTVVVSAGAGSAKISKIQDDTFYGKKQTAAMREYLEMRKVQGAGPATPREIYEALKMGGYQFESKHETVALVGLRALLRTQPNVFHKLPQGTYGLTAWYPDAKRLRAEAIATRKSKKGRKKRGGGAVKAHATPEPVSQEKPSLKVVEKPEGSPSKPKVA